MIHQDGNVTEKIAILKAAIDKTEAIIGVGVSLSSALGLVNDNGRYFNVLLLW
jgi:hypothetical protein